MGGDPEGAEGESWDIRSAPALCVLARPEEFHRKHFLISGRFRKTDVKLMAS